MLYASRVASSYHGLVISLGKPQITPSSTADLVWVYWTTGESLSLLILLTWFGCAGYSWAASGEFFSTEVTQVLVQSLVMSRLNHWKSALGRFSSVCHQTPSTNKNAAARFESTLRLLACLQIQKFTQTPTWRYFKSETLLCIMSPLSLSHSLTYRPSRYKEDKHHDSSLFWHPRSPGCLNNWVPVCV